MPGKSFPCKEPERVSLPGNGLSVREVFYGGVSMPRNYSHGRERLLFMEGFPVREILLSGKGSIHTGITNRETVP